METARTTHDGGRPDRQPKRIAFKKEVQSWFANLDNNEPVWGLPADFEFDAVWEDVKVGFWLWKMSGFAHFPTRQEVQALEPDWVSDMQLGTIIYSYMRNDSEFFAMAEDHLKRKQMRQESDG